MLIAYQYLISLVYMYIYCGCFSILKRMAWSVINTMLWYGSNLTLYLYAQYHTALKDIKEKLTYCSLNVDMYM